ncbi:hypothetical protein NKDENANG_00845 [Candidatus Entotheonellaceae bacterium PAL068K]
MRIAIWLTALMVGLTFWLSGPVTLTVANAQAPEPRTLRGEEYRNFSLKEKALLAAATAFKPESAKNALIKYYYLVSEQDLKSVNETVKVGLRLKAGEYVVFDILMRDRVSTDIEELEKFDKFDERPIESIGLVLDKRDLTSKKLRSILKDVQPEAMIRWGNESILEVSVGGSPSSISNDPN